MTVSDHLVNLAMPRNRALTVTQFDRLGWSKPITRSEATSAVYGLRGHEDGSIDRTLKRVLWPYWEDATRPCMSPRHSRLTWTPQKGKGSTRIGDAAYSERLRLNVRRSSSALATVSNGSSSPV
jgi:hypothetical protein